MCLKKIILSITIINFTVAISSGDGQPNYFEEELNKSPCSHFDTVNITGGSRNSDGSITFNGITYDSKHYSEYDYIYSSHQIKVPVKKHIRGCICLHRICVRACCPDGYVHNGGCILNPSNETRTMNVTIKQKGLSKHHDLFHDDVYGLTFTKACDGFMLVPEEYDHDRWHLERVYLLIQNV